jgi:hypothetical protein
MPGLLPDRPTVSSMRRCAGGAPSRQTEGQAQSQSRIRTRLRRAVLQDALRRRRRAFKRQVVEDRRWDAQVIGEAKTEREIRPAKISCNIACDIL